ncbi:MAG: HEPN domain-containing protein [Chloroflexi bacterium]|nr:HEPN domain-containing protein [Chloroflexota bacterium]
MVRRTVLMGQRLWQQAERDIDVARMLLQPGSYFGAANFAHQAAEKALKAACWHLRGEEPPWKHDLVKCANLVSERAGDYPPDVQVAVEQLQPMFMESRYPSGDENAPIPAELISEGAARAAVNMAEEVMAWVQRLLQQPPGRSQRKTS